MKEVKRWIYRDPAGAAYGHVVRLEDADYQKSIRPYFHGNNTAGIPDDFPAEKRLFGLETLKDTEAPVFIVEGEKCASALHGLRLQAVTSLGGSNQANKADWKALAPFKKIFLLPDNDDCGRKYAETVFRKIRSAGFRGTISLIDGYTDLPKGDICDFILSQADFSEWDGLSELSSRYDASSIENLLHAFNEMLVTAKQKIPAKWKYIRGSKGLTCISMGDMMKLNTPKPKKLLSPWLTERSLSMIFAARGVGKTYFAMNCAYALASGKPFLKYHPDGVASVLYLDGEMQAPLMIDRFKQMCANDNEAPPLHIVTPDLQSGRGVPDLSSQEGQDEIDEIIEATDSNVIFVDNLSTLCRSGNENEGESWTIVQDWAIRQRSEGRSVVFIHHTNKSGQQRGSSRREDVLDNVISLKHPDDYQAEKSGARFEVHFTKSRSLYGEDVEPILAELTEDGWKWHKVEGKFEQCVEMLNNGMPQNDIAEALEVAKSTVSKWKKKAKENDMLK